MTCSYIWVKENAVSDPENQEFVFFRTIGINSAFLTWFCLVSIALKEKPLTTSVKGLAKRYSIE